MFPLEYKHVNESWMAVTVTHAQRNVNEKMYFFYTFPLDFPKVSKPPTSNSIKRIPDPMCVPNIDTNRIIIPDGNKHQNISKK